MMKAKKRGLPLCSQKLSLYRDMTWLTGFQNLCNAGLTTVTDASTSSLLCVDFRLFRTSTQTVSLSFVRRLLCTLVFVIVHQSNGFGVLVIITVSQAERIVVCHW